ncbi:MAG: type II secretion system protein GspD [Gammaproteobacteria bacterium]|nr:type II secretion system protein GspD [Gammaproteobacteria bacterium]MYF02418.1 type II secretion system protein GspD [Gammaproteobacteria bacterium]MYI77868.1 type II secretion system protein GspD [Gammaproteobacteria bacterium]
MKYTLKKSAQGLIFVLGVSLIPHLFAQEEDTEYSVNFPDEIPLIDFINEVGRITQKTFIYDPAQVRGAVIVTAETKLNAEGVYSLLEATLRVRNLVLAEGENDVVSVIRNQDARTYHVDEDGEFDTDHKFVSRVISLEHVSSQEASRVLRQLVSAYGHLLPVIRPNAIVIADHAANVENVVRLIRQLDSDDAAQISIVLPMKHALVSDVALMLQRIFPEIRSGLGDTGVGRQITVFANENNNTLFIRGTTRGIALVSDTVEMLDQPYAITNTTKHFPLQHSDAGPLADLLTRLFVQGGPTGDLADTFTGSRDITIEADPDNNAILARANPSILAEIQNVITQVDIPRLQVLIEAAIVEITVEDSSSYGVEFGGVDETGEEIPLASTSVNGVISGLLSRLLGTTVATDDETSTGLDDGAGLSTLSGVVTPTVAIAKIDPDGISFGAIIAALSENQNSNLLSTPHVITTDNQQASIFVGQQVPFRTGTFNPNDQTGQGPVQTVERENVGITLRVTPQIRSDLTVHLQVFNDISAVITPSLGIGNAGFSDIVTNKRELTTEIVAQNRQTIVLGGLIRDDETSSIRKVPGLGSIPLLGRIFRSSATTKRKNHLLIFIRPTVIEGADDMQTVYERKMGRIWQVELDSKHPPESEEVPTVDEFFDGRP